MMNEADTLSIGAVAAGEHNVRVLTLRGRLTEQTRGELEAWLNDEISAGHIRIVVDGSGLDLITSAGVASLMRLCMRLRKRHGDVRLAGMNAPLTDMLRVLRVERLLRVYPTVEEAVAGFGQGMWM